MTRTRGLKIKWRSTFCASVSFSSFIDFRGGVTIICAMSDPDPDTIFDKTELNTVKRNKDRGVYDKHTISEIFRQAKICHVSFVHNGLPQCIPMIGAIEETAEGHLFVYFHGTLFPSHFLNLAHLCRRLSQGSFHSITAGGWNADNGDSDNNGRLCSCVERFQSLDELSQCCSTWSHRTLRG